MPVVLRGAINHHAQVSTRVQTIDKIVIDLVKSEATAGPTIVCLGRATRILMRLVEPAVVL